MLFRSVEKPITATLAEADALISLAAAEKRVLMVGQIERHSAAIRTLRENLGGRRLMALEAARVAPFRPRSLDVSVVLDLMIHDLDLALALTQAEPVTAEGEGAILRSDSWDTARSEVTFDDGFTALFDVSRVADARHRTMKLVYPSGEVEIDFLTRAFRNTTGFTLNPDFAETPEAKDTLGASIAAFLAAVRGEAPRPIVTASEAIRALDLALAVEQGLTAET